MDIKPTVARTGNEISNTQVTDKRIENTSPTSKAGNNASGNAADLTLTDAAKNLLNLQAAVSQVDDVDLAKVEAIRQSIEDGTYEIDSAKLADNLIQSSLELP